MEAEICFQFVGRNDGHALTRLNHLNLMRAFLYSLPLTVSLSLVVFFFDEKNLAFIPLCFSAAFLLLAYLVLLMKKAEDNYLVGNRVEHDFQITGDQIFKDGKEIKLSYFKTGFKYRKFLFLITTHTFLVIRNQDFQVGDREGFQMWLTKNKIPIRIGL